MKPIILIHATPQDQKRGIVQAIRNTWVHEWGDLIPHRFIYDRTFPFRPIDDEEVFDVEPGYWVMMEKTKAACQWALNRDYTHVFVICSDTYVVVPRLLKSGYADHDYSGHRADEGHAGGGCGYWLSVPAMQAVIRWPTYADYEDRWVGVACGGAGIQCFHDPRYWGYVHPWLEGIITVHLHQGDGMFNPIDLLNLHDNFLVEGDIPCEH